MIGTLTISRDIIERAQPEVLCLIDNFLDRGIRQQEILDTDRHQVHYIVDHPDFDVADAHYDLVVTSFRDPAAFMNRTTVLRKLQRQDAHGCFVTVKDY